MHPTQRGLKESQNFLRSPKLVRELLNLTTITATDIVLEIGPGRGIITRELISIARQVIAVEKDSRFGDALSPLTIGGGLEVVISDFMEYQLPTTDYKVFSNIPFNYTADIVSKLTSPKQAPLDIYLIMQRAAAQRFAGSPYYRNAQTSVLLALDFEIQILRPIDRNEFVPKPTVDIVFTHFHKRSSSLVDEERWQLVRDFIVYGYNQWAPSVLEGLKKLFTTTQRKIISQTYRWVDQTPSELSVEQWIDLFYAFERHAGYERRQIINGAENRLKKTQSNLTKLHRTRQ